MSTTDSSRGQDVWYRLADLVLDNRSTWRAAIIEMTDMPFSRYRALRRCETPVTASQLAADLEIDAPQTSVIVTDLARRGLVTREPDPADGRRKIITITQAGRTLMRDIRQRSSAPPQFAALSDDELHTLSALIDKITGAEPDTGAERDTEVNDED